MATERNVVDFKIHNLTEEQFQELKAQGKIDPNAVYFTPDTTKERLDALETKTTALEENKQDKGDYATNTALSQGLAQKQDIETAVNYDNITNCITEIPQDIKLELNNGTLTLKAGSKVYVPNGADVFDVVNITTDKTITDSTNGVQMYFINESGNLQRWTLSSCFSGTTAPTSVRYPMWYDTTNNIIKSSSDYGSTWSGKFSFPIAIVTVSNGAISSIDQVFNGFGYIGGARFVLPGVEGLAPNGFNADGTYKSVKWTTTNVLVRAIDTTGDYIDATSGTNIGMGQYIYDPATNYVYLSIISPAYRRTLTTYGHVTLNNGRVESYKTKTTFRAVDYNDTDVATTAWVRDLFETLYPVGSLYITSTNTTTCPLASIVKKSDGSNSTWALVSSGKALWTGTGSNGNSTIAAGLPNITGTIGVEQNLIGDNSTGAFSASGSGSIFTHSTNKATDSTGINFSAQNSNSIYGQSTTVQPPAYVVNVWRRTA